MDCSTPPLPHDRKPITATTVDTPLVELWPHARAMFGDVAWLRPFVFPNFANGRSETALVDDVMPDPKASSVLSVDSLLAPRVFNAAQNAMALQECVATLAGGTGACVVLQVVPTCRPTYVSIDAVRLCASSSPSYIVDKDSTMCSVLAWLRSGVFVVPTTEQLIESLGPLKNADLVGFIDDYGRLPARGELPPPHYTGNFDVFHLIGLASTRGFFAQSDEGVFYLPDVASCRDYYFLPVEKHPKGFFRLPLFPSQQRDHASQAFIIQMNAVIKDARFFLLSHRKMHPRPALTAERAPRQRGHDGPTAVDVQRAARQRAALAASAAENPLPRESDSDDDSASGSESDKVWTAHAQS